MIHALLPLYNPWWHNQDWRIEGVRRVLFSRIYASIKKKPYITVLKGTRQSGKTFLIKQTIAALIQEGINPKNIFYFLLDDLELARYIEDNPNEFGSYLKNEARTRGKLFVFFDEFQKVAGITNLIKLFYEFGDSIKFILTGSSSLQIADKISESLLGRTETWLLNPFSFKEFLLKDTFEAAVSFPPDEWTQQIFQFLKSHQSHFDSLKAFYLQYRFAFDIIASEYLPRYLLTGGYPQAALASSAEDAFLRLREIKQAFIEKDIINLLKIEKLKEFDNLLRTLALQTGGLLNYNDLQTTVNINYQTLMKFFNVLEATYLWFRLPVYASNKISSIKKRPKSYFGDVGLRNFLASTYDNMQLSKEKGAVAENFVYNQLMAFNLQHLNGLGHLYYWRSPDGNEVDFIFEYGKSLIPIEVKYQTTRQTKINRGLRTFLEREGFDSVVILTERNMAIRELNNVRYYFVPLVVFAGI